jgi:hypothetical protein
MLSPAEAREEARAAAKALEALLSGLRTKMPLSTLRSFVGPPHPGAQDGSLRLCVRPRSDEGPL